MTVFLNFHHPASLATDGRQWVLGCACGALLVSSSAGSLGEHYTEHIQGRR